MRGYDFTERTRRILAMAREEAYRLRHEYTGPEHILLGLLREGEGVAWTVLEILAIDPDALWARLDTTIVSGTGARERLTDLPYTSRAKTVLELAMKEAHGLQHQYVGSEHLLLGLLGEKRSIAAQLLAEAGVTLQAARAETRRLFDSDPVGVPSAAAQPLVARSATPPPGDATPRSVTIELQFDGGRLLRRKMHTVADAVRFLSTYEKG
jgi:ATP-dependent Clp protease ATP-binding subunit ClpC